MARCSKFPDMGIDGVNFDPEKEICGGRKISEEQRYIISWVKKIFFNKYSFVHLKGIVLFSFVKSHILGYDGVWYRSFWSEGSGNQQN